jgi:four helix bundle protein
VKVKHYRELVVWQKSMQLTKTIYEISGGFPKQEQYGLTSQMRRSAISIPSNIAEGHNRDSLKEYLRFLSIAQGSVAELETQVCLAGLLNYIDLMQEQELLASIDEIGKMLRGLQMKLSEKLLAPST